MEQEILQIQTAQIGGNTGIYKPGSAITTLWITTALLLAHTALTFLSSWKAATTKNLNDRVDNFRAGLLGENAGRYDNQPDWTPQDEFAAPPVGSYKANYNFENTSRKVKEPIVANAQYQDYV